MIIYLNIVKMFHLKQLRMGNEKQILYNNVEWNRLWGKQHKAPATMPKAVLHPKNVILCIWWIGRELSIMSSFWKTK